MNENLLISNSKLTSDSENIYIFHGQLDNLRTGKRNNGIVYNRIAKLWLNHLDGSWMPTGQCINITIIESGVSSSYM